MSKKRTKMDVVSEFISIHGNRYDYSKFEYKGIRVPGQVICKDHGPFYVTPINHRRGKKCPICSESFKSKCKRLDVDYHRALKRRQAGLTDEKIFSTGYIRNVRVVNNIVVFGKRYPNIKEAIRLLKPPANRKTISRWIEAGLSPEEAFEKIPNPGYAAGIIYLITNKINQLKYIGLTVQTLVRRWEYHIEQANAGFIKNEESLHAAIREYGKSNFTIQEIDRGTTKKDCNYSAKKMHLMLFFT